MPTLLNAVNCSKFQRGTGLTSCEPRFGRPVGFLLTKKSWNFDASGATEYTLAYELEQIRLGNLIPFLNSENFVENTGEPNRQDYDSGRRKTNRNANPDYTFDFDNGVGFHVNASDFSGSDFNVIIIDDAGNRMMQRSGDGRVLKGFTADDIWVRTYRQKTGTTNASTMVDIHLADPIAFNTQMVLLMRDEIGFNINTDINGVIDVKMTIVSASVANGVVVDVKAASNDKRGIEALGAENFQILNVTDDSVSLVTTAVASGTVIGRYTLTPATNFTTGDDLKTQTEAFGLNQATLIEDTTELYKGESNEFTATA